MKINEKLKLLRENHQWTQEDMANKLSMSVKGYSKIERGETRSNIPRLEQISKVFNMDIYELLTYGEEGKISIATDNSLINNSESSLNNTIISLGNSELSHEIEKLKLIINNRDETIQHKNEIIENQKKEIILLREMNELLRTKIK